ncbi:hypothetical protein CK203_100661 [Vitis vinifera]|uniref:Uncharacterized protein n=1 Tax=Vitis vinifera TaxID=29760 RepID=A0A438D6E3_VITVI|nr:hypothetical protein CK203_100661 [Vitis vinifera]
MDVSLESKSLPSVGNSRKSYLQVTSQRLARGKLVHLHGRRSHALPSVGQLKQQNYQFLHSVPSPATLAPRNKKSSHHSLRNPPQSLFGYTQDHFAGAQNGYEISQMYKMAAKSFHNQRLISQPKADLAALRNWPSACNQKVVEKALLDLGASVNLLPYSVYKQLGLGELKPTSITLSLANRSVKIPRGIIEDVLVQVDNFYYPVDFVVLDTDPTVKEANYVPIILGKSFLATSNAIINCRNGLMQLTFGNMTLELNIFYMSKKLITQEEEEGPEKVCLTDALVEEHYNSTPSSYSHDLLALDIQDRAISRLIQLNSYITQVA